MGELVFFRRRGQRPPPPLTDADIAAEFALDRELRRDRAAIEEHLKAAARKRH